ncbi:MAG: PAQR family membrane homeostasis protein TrhA [Desulfococcaceae bacterium]
MPPASPARAYRPGEEIANSVTHGIGAGLAIAALGVLTAFASRFGDAWHVVSVSIYGATLILLYTASTLYHGIPLPRAKAVLRVLDHVAIFLLIAGTYTPFTLVNLRGPWGWTLFGLIWALAAFGIVFELTPLRRFQRVSLSLYLGMGWVVVVAIRPMWQAVAPGGLILLAAGGLCYTLGVIFYVWRRLPYHHAIWHLFVLGGSVCHFFTVLFYVIPLGG